MEVAQLRGVRFVPRFHRWETVFNPSVGQAPGARNALRDVTEWLGFEFIPSYLEALDEEGREILKRAED